MDNLNNKRRQLINEEYLLILSLNEKNLLEVSTEQVVDEIGKYFYRIRKMIKNDNMTARDVLNHVNKDIKFKYLLSIMNYCAKLDKANQGLDGNFKDIKKRYPKKEIKKKNKEIIDKQKSELLEELIERWIALCLEDTYNLCNKKIKRGDILAYSHRKRGWSSPIYKLNENFKLEIATNFGYGRSSYFFTILSYKDILIVPFSEWVLYEWANFYEIIRYTKKYELDNESWFEAFEFAKEASNLALEDEVAFVNEYIINECEKMVAGLENFVKGNVFHFIDDENKITEIIKEGHKLIEFRGEKITGALDFIQNIVLLKDVVAIMEYITRIEKCNTDITPMLKNELELIKKELSQLNLEKLKLDPISKKISEQYNCYEILKNKIKNNLIQENDYHFNLNLNDIYDLLYPNHLKSKERYFEVLIDYNKVKNEIEILDDIKNNIVNYIEKIQNYFNKNEL